ncbi:DUF3413 domain-containing protein [Lacimicrobium alkaliphilum]|uniref:Inner membrane protein YejM N-terminal domain-containing protein n=1 Tax=Lacimicrobium alkaliphilum TaxID=1526571 RepID=A0ABQ1R062_9ALTE|nr:DUF3413 domain-containing protein [Lacimicrobium alkaliphilum]GGD53467.1 hypothetical protein GCM10011357_06570 [Lacimicrobium alkaliphilum]
MILGDTPRRQRVSKLVAWGHWFALSNIIVAICIASIYVFNSGMPDTALGMLYLFSNWFSHIAFLTFLGFILLVLPQCYLVPNIKVVKVVSSVFAAIGLALLAFDALLYTKHGLHLSLGSVEIIRSETRSAMASFTWQQWSYLSLLFIVWLSLQLIIANALWQRVERLQKQRVGLPILTFFVLCFVSSHGAHIWADANLYQPIVKQDDMFPLSYPATAKTLMSKYDLLDIQNYQRRKELQLSNPFQSATYPAEPVYCGINEQASVVVLISTVQGELGHLGSALGLNSHDQHYDISADQASARFSVLYGLPSLYQTALEQQRPVPLDLTQNLGLDTFIYSSSALPVGVTSLQVGWQDFLKKVTRETPKLAIGFVDEQELNILLAGKLHQHNTLLLTQMQPNQQVNLLTNISLPTNNNPSSHEDLMPTVLDLLQCNAPVVNYTTGQSLLNRQRDWLISNSNNKLVLLEGQQKIEVDGQGNYKITDLTSGQRIPDKLNMSRLSQSVKHLSRFSTQK